MGTRVVFDEEGNTLPPLARVADGKNVDNSSLLDQGKYFLTPEIVNYKKHE